MVEEALAAPGEPCRAECAVDQFERNRGLRDQYNAGSKSWGEWAAHDEVPPRLSMNRKGRFAVGVPSPHGFERQRRATCRDLRTGAAVRRRTGLRRAASGQVDACPAQA